MFTFNATAWMHIPVITTQQFRINNSVTISTKWTWDLCYELFDSPNGPVPQQKQTILEEK